MHLKLTIAYDGANFGGWQIQPNADTIQERVEKALAEIAKEPIRIHGSGRTDAGVHALGQVAHFDAPDHLTMNPFNWVPALNTKLPPQIRIIECHGFLYKMVRLLTGAAVQAAQGYLRQDDLYDLVNSPSEKKSPLCAPADGLTLHHVEYPVTEP